MHHRIEPKGSPRNARRCAVPGVAACSQGAFARASGSLCDASVVGEPRGLRERACGDEGGCT